ncbi:MAG: ChaN family lipoprotein [Phycisphaerales bacterium]
MSFDRLVSVFDEADVILIGELHGHPLGLMFAADLWDEGARRAPHAALSLEFLERDEQALIDDYLTGVADRSEFVERSGRERDLPEEHWRMIDTARELDRPVIASNAPRRYVKLARVEGYDRLRALTADQRRLFAIPESLPDGPYRDAFATAMGHASDSPAPGMSVDDFFRAQFMWDATMTESIIQARAAGARPVTQVVGQFHVIRGQGIAGLLADHPDDLLVWSIAIIDEWSDRLRDEDQGMADAVIYVGSADDAKPSTDR